MHIELEISNVSGRVDIGGVSQPIISQKKIVHDIRIREGEVNLLGGLMQTQDTSRPLRVFRGLPICRFSDDFSGREHVEKIARRAIDRADPACGPRPGIYRSQYAGIAAGNDQPTSN